MLRFDVRGIGESEGRPEDDTITRRITDLGAAIDYICPVPVAENGSDWWDRASAVMFHYSRRPPITITKSGHLAIWATPLRLDDLKSKEATEGNPLPAKAFFEDLPRHRLEPVLGRISNAMVIHGTEDRARSC